jgi:hypothetical protein
VDDHWQLDDLARSSSAQRRNVTRAPASLSAADEAQRAGKGAVAAIIRAT